MNINAAFSGYSANDIPACKTFYGQTLGIELVDEMGGIGFTINGQRVYIYPKDDHQPATYTVLNLVVASIDEAIDELTARGVTFLRYDSLPAPQDDRGVLRGKAAGMGPDIAWCEDPSGNIIGIVEE